MDVKEEDKVPSHEASILISVKSGPGGSDQLEKKELVEEVSDEDQEIEGEEDLESDKSFENKEHS